MNNQNPEIYDAIIIGAGLTGLTLGYYLNKKGKKILILEKEPRSGGAIKTIRKNGFVYECGPNTAVLSTPEFAELLNNLENDCQVEKANEKSKVRLIWKHNRWNALPTGFVSAIRTPLFTPYDKLRILSEPFRSKGKNPNETVADLVKRRLGKSYLTYAVDPFISGIYAGDPNKLVTRFALPKLYNLEQNYGSFIWGAVKKKNETKTELEKQATREVISVNGGFQNLIDALEKAIDKSNIIHSCEYININKKDNAFAIKTNLQEFNCHNVITTIGNPELKDILNFISPEKLKSFDKLAYAKVIQVALGYKRWKGIPLNAFGGLVPSIENRNILGVLFLSSMFNGRCPNFGAMLSVFLGGTKNEVIYDKPDDEIMKIVLESLKEMLQQKEMPDLIEIMRYPYAIPQYERSTEERLKAIEDIQNEFPGLFLAGNIRDGIGIADRVKQAKLLVDTIK